MSVHTEIDEVLGHLGRVEPPAGMQQRMHGALRQAPRRFSPSVIYGTCGIALAAGLALATVALSPAVRNLVLPHHAAVQGPGVQNNTHAPGSFGSIEHIHVPVEPVLVQPVPVNQGRGHSRTGRATLPTQLAGPLPRGVSPTQPATHAGDR